MDTNNAIIHSFIKHKLINEQTLQHALQQAKHQNKPIMRYLIDENIVSANSIADCIANDFSLPLLDLRYYDKTKLITDLVEQTLIHKHHVIPLYQRGCRLFLGMSDPTQIDAINEIRFHTGLNITPILVADDQLQHTIAHFTQVDNSLGDFNDLNNISLDAIDISADADMASTGEEQPSTQNDAPIIRFVNKIIFDAIQQKTSDIHFEPYENTFRIRYRRDGLLYDIAHLPITVIARIIARLKVMANLDISERRIPQDGRFKIHLSNNRSVSLRVNTCPTLFGEKVVLRILDPSSTSMGMDKLGFSDAQKKIFQTAIHKPQGMILVTGPTGSGKTVTLYTALSILNTNEKNISTVEDPVEIFLTGINQVAINLKTGLNFANTLRAFLRQDPDIIMVGEIRDTETAEISIKAAQTGHLVLSTLHTNSAAETLGRLENMGVANYNTATSVILVIAQRLVRRLCQHCKTPVKLPKQTLLDEGFCEQVIKTLVIYQAKGCQHCINGYQGRVGIYEVLPITRTIQQIIMSNANTLDIEDRAIKEGMINLRQAGLQKVAQGITSLAEVNRATKE